MDYIPVTIANAAPPTLEQPLYDVKHFPKRRKNADMKLVKRVITAKACTALNQSKTQKY